MQKESITGYAWLSMWILYDCKSVERQKIIRQEQQDWQDIILSCPGAIASLSCGITQDKPGARQEETNPLSVMEEERLYPALHMIGYVPAGFRHAGTNDPENPVKKIFQNFQQIPHQTVYLRWAH